MGRCRAGAALPQEQVVQLQGLREMQPGFGTEQAGEREEVLRQTGVIVASGPMALEGRPNALMIFS